jgi:collagenase-like PrtC family protease
MTAEERAWCRRVAKIYDEAIDLGYSPAQAMQRIREKLAEEQREEAQRVTD